MSSDELQAVMPRPHGEGVMTERAATLELDGWAGRSSQPVVVVGETPKRYRIRADEYTQLGGRNRWLYPGETALVPKHAIRFVEAS